MSYLRVALRGQTGKARRSLARAPELQSVFFRVLEQFNEGDDWDFFGPAITLELRRHVAVAPKIEHDVSG